MTTTSSAAPVSDIDPFDDDVRADLYGAYRTLRDTGPVVRLTAHPTWALTRYADVRAALADWETFSSASGVALNDVMNTNLQGTVLGTDPPQHDVLRSVLAEKLAPRGLAKLRDDIVDRADALVAEVAARGSFDAVTELCERLPIDVVADLIGLPEEGRERLLPGADAVFAGFGPMGSGLQKRLPTLLTYFEYMQSFDSRDKLAPDSWGAALWDAVDEGRIPAESAVALMTAYLSAGMDTTVHGLSSYIRFLAEDPQLWADLKAHPELLASGFEEALRLESPVQEFFRLTTRNVDVDGVTIPEGTRVLLCFGAANRDERHYPDPDRFDLRRNPVDHLAFGYATHGCAGQGLARIEAQALVGALLRRVTRIELAGPPVLHDNPIARGLAHLPVVVEGAR